MSKQTTTHHRGHQGVNRLTRFCRSRWKKHRTKYLYDPFGNTLSQYGLLADANAYRFSSKEWNANSGLYYYLYRLYDANLQRWLNRDPIEENGGINLYKFALNAPTIYVDRFGLLPFGIGSDFALPSGLIECTSITGFYRHCMNSCRLMYSYGGPLNPYGALVVNLIALVVGKDYYNSDPSSPSDRYANIVGATLALKLRSCQKGCESSLRSQIAKYCCPIAGKKDFDKDDPKCCETK